MNAPQIESQRDSALQPRVDRAADYPGSRAKKCFNPNGVASFSSHRWATTPLGLMEISTRIPRVARSSQPWAERRCPVGPLGQFPFNLPPPSSPGSTRCAGSWMNCSGCSGRWRRSWRLSRPRCWPKRSGENCDLKGGARFELARWRPTGYKRVSAATANVAAKTMVASKATDDQHAERARPDEMSTAGSIS